jgi:hypothetical protein
MLSLRIKKGGPIMTIYEGPVPPYKAMKIGYGPFRNKWAIFGRRPNVSAAVWERKADGIFRTKREAEDAMRAAGLI